MNNVVRSSNPTQRLFAKTTVVTLAVSLIVVALTVLTRGICAMIFSQKLSVCRSLYQIFGDGSVGIINLVIGILTAALLFALGLGLFFARAGAKSSPPSLMGLSFLKYVLYGTIIYTALAVVVSFASVSVINYDDIDSYVGFINLSAGSLFWLTILFGTAFICCEVAFIRLINSMIRNLTDGTIVKRGAGLIFVSSALGIITAIIAFCMKLYKLVMPPKNYIQNITQDKAVESFSNSAMILNTFNVLIFASLVVIFITLSMLAASYLMSSDSILRAARISAYNAGHMAANPEDIPDYTTENNYNYNQSPNFVPYYKANKTYQDVYKNIYTGEEPPVPPTPENPFRPKTQYPTAPASSNNPSGPNYTPPANN